jgi:hypothetical protein
MSLQFTPQGFNGLRGGYVQRKVRSEYKSFEEKMSQDGKFKD